MLHETKKIQGVELLASDGAIGNTVEFLFETEDWSVRYLVVETGSWLKSRRVLLAPHVAGEIDWKTGKLVVNLTREEVRDSPSADLEQPISRRYQTELHNHYGWPMYWAPTIHPGGGIGVGGALGAIPPRAPDTTRDSYETESAVAIDEENALHSTKEVRGYGIEAADGSIGHVEDFLIDDREWLFRYLVIDTRNWLPGRKVVVSPHWITDIVWTKARVAVDLDRETIKNSPPYEGTDKLQDEYYDQLHDYYQRPRFVRR